MSTFQSSSDAFHNVCIPESALDDPGVWSKYSDVPPTCLASNVPMTPEVLAQSLGHDPTWSDWSVFVYRYMRENFPDRPLFGVDDPIGPIDTPQVSVPWSGILLLTGLLFIFVIRRYRRGSR